MKIDWQGVFPAVTTQFNEDLSINVAETQRVVDALIKDGVTGIIAMGTVGENNSLLAAEKRTLLKAIIEVVAKRVPVITGISELTTPLAIAWAKDAEKLGADGLMLLPAMVYVPKTAELVEHFTQVANATTLPVMLYNNPTAYRVAITNEALEALRPVTNIVAVKESTADTRRFTDMYNAFGDRYIVFAGLDDVAFEGLLLGAQGWVSGLTSAFPQESVMLVKALEAGDIDTAREIYRWFLPLLHLDAEHDLVQSIKLAEQIMGRGSERVRMPRLPLTGARRAEGTVMGVKAAATRPSLKSTKAA
jgi:4-hydroxy-tetrahydrodipicolinate synthase